MEVWMFVLAFLGLAVAVIAVPGPRWRRLWALALAPMRKLWAGATLSVSTVVSAAGRLRLVVSPPSLQDLSVEERGKIRYADLSADARSRVRPYEVESAKGLIEMMVRHHVGAVLGPANPGTVIAAEDTARLFRAGHKSGHTIKYIDTSRSRHWVVRLGESEVVRVVREGDEVVMEFATGICTRHDHGQCACWPLSWIRVNGVARSMDVEKRHVAVDVEKVWATTHSAEEPLMDYTKEET